MTRLVAWLRHQAGSLRTERVTHGSRTIVRTVETVQCQQGVIHFGGLQGGSMDACPLCGSKLGAPVDDHKPPLLDG